MLDKQIKKDVIIISENSSSEDEGKTSKHIENRKKYQAKYGNKEKYCSICDKYIKQFSWQNHLRSKTHKLKKEIHDLKNNLICVNSK